MPNSTRYAIHQALYGLVQGVAAKEAADSLYNPALPAGLQGRGVRVLFLLDRGDQLVDQPGQREKRRTKVVLGALARTTDPDRDADALLFAARIALRGARAVFSAAGIDAPILRETQVEPELKETQSDGALLLSAFEVEYRETYPGA